MNITTHIRRNHEGINVEHFYFGSEGDNLDFPDINSTKRIKGLSLSMAYHYNSNLLKIRYRTKENRNADVFYATFGLGTQRTFYALFDSHRDERGFNLPLDVCLYNYSIIPVTSNDKEVSEKIYLKINKEALFDDRNLHLGNKASFSDYIGIPKKIIVGNGHFTIKNRDESLEKKFDTIENLLGYLQAKKELY